KREGYCNGFTLGSHGQYFVDRQSSKNIQFPYESYAAHYCLGILYTRNENIDEKKIYKLDDIVSIASVIKNIEFFFIEKWKIASDKSGSGNTANIGSVKKIDDLLFGNGTFAKYGETIFDDYWINYGKITIKNKNGNLKKITNIDEFLQYRGILKK
ncbi:MAG: EcoRV family type II restriction endonuclease, partial [Elusimicrobiota bacterium]|nr:EcoRV family type II restriction endonuclease [Elusimicrobiota bacterium]